MADEDFPRISDSDIHKLRQWNRDEPYPIPRCVHDMVQQQTEKCPGAPAVDSWDGQLTYQRLDELSSRLGHHLVDLGATTERFVPLCFEKSMWAVVSMLAVLKAGSAFTFVEPSHPIDRIRSMLQDINASILLTSPTVSPILAVDGMSSLHRVLITDTLIREIDCPATPPETVVQPSNAAVALFTSGSTGKPKGIIQEHSTAAFSAETCAKTFGIGPGSRVLQWAAYCFDMSVIDMLTTLVGGGCICIPSENMRMNDIEGAMRRLRVDCAAMTPSTAQVLKSANLPDFRTLILGGEAVSREHLKNWPQHIRILNGYGPGEASVCVAGDALLECPSNIGKAVGSVVWIVDECSYRLAPVGKVGELLIEGPLLARGYLNDPEKTAAGFIENPPWLEFFRPPNERRGRMYRTGDLGRYHANGSIEFVGRKDSQIKLRGQRIEPGDIEYHICQSLPAGAAVAVDVITRPGGSAASRLAAFVGFDGTCDSSDTWEARIAVDPPRKEDLEVHLQGLQGRLSRQLPAYMIPSFVILVTHLPLTASGKLDRKLLRHIGSSLPVERLVSIDHSPGPEHGSSEKEGVGRMRMRIAELWRKILHMDRSEIGPNDNFFKLGGDSINAMQLVKAAGTVDITLTTTKIFQHPTLTGMSLSALGDATANGPTKAMAEDRSLDSRQFDALVKEMHCPGLTVDSNEIEDITEAPDLQAYMVACGLLKTHGYINYFAFDLTGLLDGSRLAESCRMLVQRHSILRTVFALHRGRIYQIVRRSYNPEFTRYSSQEATHTLLTNLCEEELCCDTQLGDDIVRFLLVERGVDKHTLIMRLSHAQFDGTSLALIYRDLQKLYTGEDLPPVPQYTDWTRAANEANSSRAEDYWRQLLKGSRMTSILDHSKTPYQHIINSRVSSTIPFISTVQEHGFTVATLVKAAWAVVLAELSSTTDIIFANAVTGRNVPVPSVDQIVGDCNNAVLVRANLDPDATPTALSLFKHIQDQLVAAIPHENIGCRQLVEKCTDWPRWTRYSTSVNHQNYTDAALDAFSLGPETRCRVSYRDLESDRRDIQIYSYPPTDGGVMRLEMAFSDRAIATEDVEAMLQRLGETVQRLAGDVDAPLRLGPSPLGEKTIPLGIRASEDEPSQTQARVQSSAQSMLHPDVLVEAVWRRFEHLFFVAPTEEKDPTRSPTEKEMMDGGVDDDTPFYAVGGDLVYAAQLCAWYQHEGVAFPMEALIELPTKRLQKERIVQCASSPSSSSFFTAVNDERGE